MSLGEMAGVADKCYNDIATDMGVGQILSYASAAKGMNMENIKFLPFPVSLDITAPRRVQRSYYSIHKKEYVDLINEHFMPYSDETLTVDDIKIKELHTQYEPLPYQRRYRNRPICWRGHKHGKRGFLIFRLKYTRWFYGIKELIEIAVKALDSKRLRTSRS